MKSKCLFFLLLSVVIAFTSCSDSTSADDTLKSIPQDISMLTAIDADAILEKADFENVKKMAFYQELVTETKRYNATLGEVLMNPQSSGIDLSKNIYIAHHVDIDNPEDVFVAIVATVKDKAALEALINSDDKLKISKQEGFDLGMKGSQSVAWNGQKVVLGMTNSYSDPTETIQSFFNTTAESSIANDGDLKKALAGNHDIASWMSSNALAKSESLKNVLVMGGISPDAAKDNYIHSHVDFNKGAIESNTDMYLQSALMEDINLLFKNNVKTDFAAYIPSNANSAMTVALDFQGIQSVLQKKGVSMFADFALKEYGLSVNDIANTFGGDILLYATPGSSEAPIGTFATNVVENDNLDQFLTAAIDYGVLEKIGDNLYSIKGTGMMAGGFNTPDAQLLIQKDMVVISGDAGHLGKIAAGGFSGSDQMDKTKIKALNNNILAGFLDFTSMLNDASENVTKMNLKFKDLNFITNRKNSNLKLDFKEKDTNALKQLFESINEIYLADKKGEI